MPLRTDARAGFMLVEVLAALLVTAALVAVVLPYAGQLIARWQTGQASIAQTDAWMRALARLTDDVSEAIPMHQANNPSILAVTVTPKRIEFVRPTLGHPDVGTRERVTYRAEAAAGGERLVRSASPLSGGDVEGGASSVSLLEGPFRFRFSAVDRNGQNGVWTDQETMPVRIVLVVVSADGRRLPFSPIPLPIAARATRGAVIPRLRQTASPLISRRSGWHDIEHDTDDVQ